jgi:integrating conjugative element protein (TIGR03765 family)
MKAHTSHRFSLTLLASMAMTIGHQQAGAQSQVNQLIVVADQGGASALPFYEAIDVTDSPSNQAPTKEGTNVHRPALKLDPKPTSDQDMLPVRSPSLSPGTVSWRSITSPLLKPIFLVGDDSLSRAWLRQRLPLLRQMKATGFVVNASTAPALQALRQLAPGVTLKPASGDDLGQRLQIRHYPVLITATTIQQ